MKHLKLRRGAKEPRNPLYLNAMLIYSEALNRIKKPTWNRIIKAGTLGKLKSSRYNLTTSILTRMEIMQRLCRDENKQPGKARKIYLEILNDFEIYEITSIHELVNLTPDFIDSIGCTNLDFKDALHLEIAKRLNISLCTHDKKIKGNFSQQGDKIKFYERVYKPEELIIPKK